MSDFRLCAFDAVTEQDSMYFGRKAVCQALLSTRGFYVPEGFLLRAENESCLEETYAQAVREFPHVLRGSAIMRSSAPGEDGNMSYAGVYKSIVFNGRSFPAFARAATVLLASYAAPQASCYSLRVGFNKNASSDGHLTALVQRLLTPDCSGIAYTLDPVTGLKHVIIESTHGNNSLLTDGKISPDYVCLDERGVITTKRLGKKQQLLCVQDGLVMQRAVTDFEAGMFSISNDQIYELWNTALCLQRIFDKPQDIEWAFENGRLYILQTRQITI